MDTHVVGPLIARDTETAKALIASLAARTDRPLRTDIDVRHEELLAWVKARGLASVTFNAVMTYGVPRPSRGLDASVRPAHRGRG